MTDGGDQLFKGSLTANRFTRYSSQLSCSARATMNNALAWSSRALAAFVTGSELCSQTACDVALPSSAYLENAVDCTVGFGRPGKDGAKKTQNGRGVRSNSRRAARSNASADPCASYWTRTCDPRSGQDLIPEGAASPPITADSTSASLRDSQPARDARPKVAQWQFKKLLFQHSY
jgi:hypothetical protein